MENQETIILVYYLTIRGAFVANISDEGTSKGLAQLLMNEAHNNHFIKLVAILVNDTLNLYNNKLSDEQINEIEKTLFKTKENIIKNRG